MSHRILGLAALLVVASLSGCMSRRDKTPKSSAHIYENDAPTIHYHDEPETAGGPITPY